MTPRILALMLAMCLAWGFHFVVLKLTVGHVAPPMFYAAVRMTILALILSPLLRIHRGVMWRILAAGICFGGLNYAFMFSAVTYVNASVVAVVIESYAPFAMILSVIFLKEQVGWRRVGGLIAALAGVVLIASAKEGLSAGDSFLFGVALTLCGAMVEAIGAILVKQLKDVKPLALLAWFSLVGACVLWGLTLVMEDNRMIFLEEGNLWPFIWALSYSIILGSLFGHTTYYYLLQKLPVSQVAATTLLTTFIAVVASIAILGEPLTWKFFVGGVMVLFGVAIILTRSAAKKTPIELVAPIES